MVIKRFPILLELQNCACLIVSSGDVIASKVRYDFIIGEVVSLFEKLAWFEHREAVR